MFAFSTPLALSSSSSSSSSLCLGKLHLSSLQSNRYLVTKFKIRHDSNNTSIIHTTMSGKSDDQQQEEWKSQTEAAVKSGQDLRDQLTQMSDERQNLASKTEGKLNEMNDRLSVLMSTIREEIGLPPVADLPEGEKSIDTLSSDISSKTSNKNGNNNNNNNNTTSSSSSSSSNDVSSSSSDEPYMDPKNFGYEATAGWQVLAESLQLPENEESVQFKVQCDTNGCSLIELKPSAYDDENIDENDNDNENNNNNNKIEQSVGVRSNFIISGPGFRVGFDPNSQKSCCALVGGSDSWTIGLSYEEIRHFKRLCLSLKKKMDQINSKEDLPLKDSVDIRKSADGFYNMRISRVGVDCSVEHETKLLWVQAIGQPISGQYCIRAIFMEGRKVEMYWAPDCVNGLLSALNKLRIE